MDEANQGRRGDPWLSIMIPDPTVFSPSLIGLNHPDRAMKAGSSKRTSETWRQARHSSSLHWSLLPSGLWFSPMCLPPCGQTDGPLITQRRVTPSLVPMYRLRPLQWDSAPAAIGRSIHRYKEASPWPHQMQHSEGTTERPACAGLTV